MDHTVIDAGHHRLLIETIPVALANYRYPGTPLVPLVPPNGRFRRLSPLPSVPAKVA
jgi:hypothetical protein